MELKLFGMCAYFEKRPEALPLEKAIVHAYNSQLTNWDPYAPPTEWAYMTLENVRSYFPKSYAKYVGLFTSIGTPLDFWWGIDAFISCGVGVATIDATRDTLSSKSTFVDVLVYDNRFDNYWNECCKNLAVLSLDRYRTILNITEGCR